MKGPIPEGFEDFCEKMPPYGVIVNKNEEMTLDQHLQVLIRVKSTIENEGLNGEDDNTPGNKSTTANWGLCSESKHHYPTPELHIWPVEFAEHGRVAPITKPKGTKCPMNREQGRDGCFYTCRVFNPKKKENRLDKEFAIELYTKEIKKVEKLIKGEVK